MSLTKIGTEFQINTYTISHQQYVSVTWLSNENFVVTWQSYRQDCIATTRITDERQLELPKKS